MMKPSKTDQQERLVELRAAGYSYASIAETLGVSKPTLIAWSRTLEQEIHNARALRLDALFEQFAVAKEKRIEAFGKVLQRILMELDKRDLSAVKTEALLTLALKYGDSLRGEHEPLVLGSEGSVADDPLEALCRVHTWRA
jgi:transposase-like protein